MRADNDSDPSQARQQRAAGLVIAIAILGWMLAQYLGGRGVLTTRVLFLIDFAALAAMVWALVVTYRIWRRRRDPGSR